MGALETAAVLPTTSPIRPSLWRPGQLLWRAPRLGSLAPVGEFGSGGCNGTVVLIDTQPTENGEYWVTDGRETVAAPEQELEDFEPGDVETIAWIFSHGAATPSPRCTEDAAEIESPAAKQARTPPEASRLGWLTTAGLRCAGQATFEVPGRALRHVIGRGGATIRRLEAALGVLIGASDGPGGKAVVALCGPSERLEDAEKVVRLVGQGHRTLLAHIVACAGGWVGEAESGNAGAD